MAKERLSPSYSDPDPCRPGIEHLHLVMPSVLEVGAAQIHAHGFQSNALLIDDSSVELDSCIWALLWDKWMTI